MRHGTDLPPAGHRHGARRRLERTLLLGQFSLGIGLLIAAASPSEATVSVTRGLAAGLLAGGGTLAGLSALVALRRNFRVVPSPKPGGELVAHGVYRWLRHPMYTAVLMVVAALATLRPSPPVLVLSALNFAFYLAKARYEEGLLLAHYPGYARYRERTLGVLPGFPDRAFRLGSDSHAARDVREDR